MVYVIFDTNTLTAVNRYMNECDLEEAEISPNLAAPTAAPIIGAGAAGLIAAFVAL